MQKQFEILRKTRAYLLSIVDELTVEQLNTVPQGFNNNIIWNFGHVIAAQQGVCYKRGGLPMLIEEDLFNSYKPESKPAERVEENEIQRLKGLLFSTIDDLEKDYKANKFTGYIPWKTRYGVEINNIEEAITFLSFHDGLHIGYTMALRRVVSNK
jgi:hypothetical protein